MHMYSAAIDTLPDPHDPEFPHRAGIILAGLRKLQGSLSEAAGRSRVTPSVIVALSGVRHRYDELMETAAHGPGSDAGSAAVHRPRTGQAVDQGGGQRGGPA